MDELDTIDEILEFAISREAEAYEFYMYLAGRVADAKMRRVLEVLAQEELEHKAKLELEMLKEGVTLRDVEAIGGLKLSDYIAEYDGELNLDYKDLLVLAMKKETVSFKLYASLSGLVSDEGMKDVLLTIAEEEVKHKMRFEAEYDAILKSKKQF